MCSPGHHHLWIHGIHHGDISLRNLMYNPSPTGKPEGVLNDYDLASLVNSPTTNTDRTGTIPFLALDMLDHNLDGQIPRLYRHDAESFIWVLTYITLADVEYNGHAVKISRPPSVGPWFCEDCEGHFVSKHAFPSFYGTRYPVTESYKRYSTTIRSLMGYLVRPNADSLHLRSSKSAKLEINDPKEALQNLIRSTETGMGADGEEFVRWLRHFSERL